MRFEFSKNGLVASTKPRLNRKASANDCRGKRTSRFQAAAFIEGRHLRHSIQVLGNAGRPSGV